MVRFLADASLHDATVTGCRRREPAMDFLSANEANLEGIPDPEVLAFATQQDRILGPFRFPDDAGLGPELLRVGYGIFQLLPAHDLGLT